MIEFILIEDSPLWEHMWNTLYTNDDTCFPKCLEKHIDLVVSAEYSNDDIMSLDVTLHFETEQDKMFFLLKYS